MDTDSQENKKLLKPIEIKRMARVPYDTVIGWLEAGHPRAGILPSIDLAESGKRHSYRIRQADWEAFQARLLTAPRTRARSAPPPRPRRGKSSSGVFRY